MRKIIKLSVAGIAIALGTALTFNAIAKQDAMVEKAVEDRIKPMGDMRVGTREEIYRKLTPKELVEQLCFNCHGFGALGAPKIGNKPDWAKRKAKGMDTLMKHAINGFNDMPPKGGNPMLSKKELKGAIEYMMKKSGV